MSKAAGRRLVRGSGAFVGDRGITAKLLQDDRSRDALDRIHAMLLAAGRERPLSQIERRIRCMSAPRPWRDLGISNSTWHRRRRKMAALVEREAVAA
jgi:hypothetical protein